VLEGDDEVVGGALAARPRHLLGDDGVIQAHEVGGGAHFGQRRHRLLLVAVQVRRGGLPHPLAVFVRRRVYAHVYHADGDERHQDHRRAVGDGVDGVQHLHCPGVGGAAATHPPKRTVTVRGTAQHSEHRRHQPRAQDQEHRPALVYVEVVPQRVDHAEVLVHPDQQDAQDGGGAHETGARLGGIAEGAVVPRRRRRRIDVRQREEALVGLDDLEVGRVVDQLLAEEQVGDLDRLVGLERLRGRRRLVHYQERDQEDARQQIRDEQVDDESANYPT
jgi:hypothetical protein